MEQLQIGASAEEVQAATEEARPLRSARRTKPGSMGQIRDIYLGKKRESLGSGESSKLRKRSENLEAA